jgi:hypothetical protein
LRSEWAEGTKNFAVQATYYQNMESLASLKSAQGDIGMIFSYMKMLDPTSSVREGEQATARNAPGVAPQIIAMYNRALKTNGPFFTDDARKGFLDPAKKMYEDGRADAEHRADFLIGMAERLQLDARNVVTPIGGVSYESRVKAQAPQTPGPVQQNTGAPAPRPTSGTPPQASEAGVLPSPQNATPAAPKKPAPTFEQSMNTWLNSTFQKKGKR